MGMMIKKLDPNDPRVARNRALSRVAISTTATQYQIGIFLTERIKECFEAAKACGITINHNVVFYDEYTETIIFE